jgi:hypothetical protein
MVTGPKTGDAVFRKLIVTVFRPGKVLAWAKRSAQMKLSAKAVSILTDDDNGAI